MNPTDTAEAFLDPVAYLARFGIEAELVEQQQTVDLPAAA